MMKSLLSRMFCILFVGLVLGGTLISAAGADEIPVAIARDGSVVLKSLDTHQGLSIVNTATGKEIKISDAPGAGYFASLSPDAKKVCFKMITVEPDGSRSFVPAIYSVATGKTIALSEPSVDAGTPVVSADGNIAFTVGKTLTVLDAKMNVLGTFDLGHAVNLLGLSPDGSQIAYNNKEEQIALCNLTSGESRVLTDGSGAFWNPQFSPDGNSLLV
ncbi:MAG TPA: hypothetical protein PKH07_19960, partial [bacterium]|nr:hypothetical protein [bacterium]